MCHSKELEPLRNNLRNNLWRIINRESLQIFPFMEYLVDILVDRNKKIMIMSTKLLKKYRDILKDEYTKTIDYIQVNIPNADIIGLEQYIKDKINGNITQILNDFIEEYEENKESYKHRRIFEALV